jgi:hypothetical protein
MSILTPIDDYMMQNPKLAFIDEAIHPKSAFIHEAICAENEIKHELKTSTITYPNLILILINKNRTRCLFSRTRVWIGRRGSSTSGCITTNIKSSKREFQV